MRGAYHLAEVGRFEVEVLGLRGVEVVRVEGEGEADYAEEVGQIVFAAALAGFAVASVDEPEAQASLEEVPFLA